MGQRTCGLVQLVALWGKGEQGMGQVSKHNLHLYALTHMMLLTNLIMSLAPVQFVISLVSCM